MGHLRLGRRLLGPTAGAWILVAGGLPAFAEPDQAAQAEIAALLTAVGTSGCTFIRNGEPGTAADARAHLERKYRYARKKLDSAETFIERVASKSSTTGRPYLVECPGEPQRPTGEWLFDRLAEIRGS
jgi:hypothetical protein